MKPIRQRFDEKYTRGANNGCWLWTGSINSKGYGRIFMKGGNQLAHRVSWILHRGQIPEGYGYHGTCVLHHCDNPPCVNPAHLFLGTPADNARDMIDKKRGADRNGGKNPKAKLTVGEVKQIRKYYAPGGCAPLWLAQVYGVSRDAIYGVVNRRNWRHI